MNTLLQHFPASLPTPPCQKPCNFRSVLHNAATFPSSLTNMSKTMSHHCSKTLASSRVEKIFISICSVLKHLHVASFSSIPSYTPCRKQCHCCCITSKMHWCIWKPGKPQDTWCHNCALCRAWLSSCVWAISCNACCICVNSVSPCWTTSSSCRAASWFSSSNRHKLASWGRNNDEIIIKFWNKI